MAEPLAEALGASRLLVGAREAGAGSLLARLLNGRAQDSNMLALLEGPAERYFASSPHPPMVLPAALSSEALREAARAAIEAFRPDHVIVGASAGFTIEKALIEVAGAAGLPVVSVVDHYWNLWQRYAGDLPTDRWRYRPDVIAVPDPWCRDRLRQLGCPVDSIVVFEHPLLWEPQPAVDKELAAKVRARLGIEPDGVVVLFVSEYGFPNAEDWNWDQPDERDVYRAAEGLVGIARELADQSPQSIQVVIRPHPSETRDWRILVDKQDRQRVLLGNELSKTELFALADIAFGLNSMLLAEAGRAGLPSYSWFPDQSYSGLRLSQFAYWVQQCQSLESCRTILLSILKH